MAGHGAAGGPRRLDRDAGHLQLRPRARSRHHLQPHRAGAPAGQDPGRLPPARGDQQRAGWRRHADLRARCRPQQQHAGRRRRHRGQPEPAARPARDHRHRAHQRDRRHQRRGALHRGQHGPRGHQRPMDRLGLPVAGRHPQRRRRAAGTPGQRQRPEPRRELCRRDPVGDDPDPLPRRCFHHRRGRCQQPHRRVPERSQQHPRRAPACRPGAVRRPGDQQRGRARPGGARQHGGGALPGDQQGLGHHAGRHRGGQQLDRHRLAHRRQAPAVGQQGRHQDRPDHPHRPPGRGRGLPGHAERADPRRHAFGPVPPDGVERHLRRDSRRHAGGQHQPRRRRPGRQQQLQGPADGGAGHHPARPERDRRRGTGRRRCRRWL